MNESRETVCITCGLPAGDSSRLNHLPGGQPCPSCRDRLLDTLPPLLPGEIAEIGEEADERPAAPEASESDERAEPEPPPQPKRWSPASPERPA